MKRLSSYGFTPRSEGNDSEASSSGEQPDNQKPRSRVDGTATASPDREESDNYNIILLLLIIMIIIMNILQ